ncbi:MAG: hypothetical protein ACE5IQ_03675 [Candidatus Methylomirabilales bacterium]
MRGEGWGAKGDVYTRLEGQGVGPERRAEILNLPTPVTRPRSPVEEL